MYRTFSAFAKVIGMSSLLVGCQVEKEQQNDDKFLGPKLFPDEIIAVQKKDDINEMYGVIYEIDTIATKTRVDYLITGYVNWELDGLDQDKKRSDFVSNLKNVIAGKYNLVSGWKKTLSKKCPKDNQPSRRPGGKICSKKDTDLSASLDKVSYFGYVLNHQKTNWQFTRLPDPIKIFSDSNTDYYKDPFSLKSGATSKPVMGEMGQIGARAVFFSADAPSDMQNGTKGEYSAAFNLYTEVISSDGDESYVPIVIDPDVKWPGGND